jgi:hypothetical protein
MAGYYVIFNREATGIYTSWFECAKHVLGISNAIYQKYSTYDEAIREFEARWMNSPTNLGEHGHNPYHVVPLLGLAEQMPAQTGEGNHGCSKVVIIICLAILLLGLWLLIHLCLR